MGTEEDTIRILKRLSFKEVEKLYYSHWDMPEDATIADYNQRLELLLYNSGWTRVQWDNQILIETHKYWNQ